MKSTASMSRPAARWLVDRGTPRRALANAVIVDGFFAAMWFGWGQEGPPAWESTVLVLGEVLAALVAVVGILAARRARHEPSPLADPEARRGYQIVVGTEFGSMAVGAAILGASGHGKFIAAWFCLVVGVHFVPLRRVFAGIHLAGLAVALLLVAVGAAIVGATSSVLPSSVAGLGAGACLLVHAASLLAGARCRRDGEHPEAA